MPRRRKARITPTPGETLGVGYKTNAKRTTRVTSIYTVPANKTLFRKMGKGIFGFVASPAAPARNAAKVNKRKRAASPIASPKSVKPRRGNGTTRPAAKERKTKPAAAPSTGGKAE